MATNYIFEEGNLQYLFTVWSDGTCHMAIKDMDIIPQRWSAPIKLIRTESITE